MIFGTFVLFGVIACDEVHWNALFPPDGIYDPILEIETKKGQPDYSGELVNQFAGKYSISLAFEKPAPIAQGYDLSEIQMSCAFSAEGGIVELPCGKTLVHFWGDESGLSVARYSVPEDIPKGMSVDLRVAFKSTLVLDELIATRGKVRIFVQKWSDL
ncbi:MAG: hypothetical protein ACSLE2_02495 [Lysobacterales bacterium]